MGKRCPDCGGLNTEDKGTLQYMTVKVVCNDCGASNVKGSFDL